MASSLFSFKTLPAACRPSTAPARGSLLPLPRTLVVNTGEMLELATRGYYVATVHRVQSSAVDERFSIPYFVNARLDAELGALPLDEAALSGIAGGHEGEVEAGTRIFSVYGENAFKGLARSHVDVAWRHWPGYAGRVGLSKKMD